MIKRLALILVLALAGCVSISREQSDALAAASSRYAGINGQMTKEQVIQLLGAPQREESGVLTWEERIGSKNLESLSVEFTAGSRIAKLTRVSSRYSWSGFGSAGISTEKVQVPAQAP